MASAVTAASRSLREAMRCDLGLLRISCDYVFYSSQTGNSQPPLLKVQLRELYKRVHPDLFHDIPFARQANEHSFKLLQVDLRSISKCYPTVKVPSCCAGFTQSTKRTTEGQQPVHYLPRNILTLLRREAKWAELLESLSSFYSICTRSRRATSARASMKKERTKVRYFMLRTLNACSFFECHSRHERGQKASTV